MRTFSRVFLASLAVCAPLAFAACSDDPAPDGDSDTDSSTGGTAADGDEDGDGTGGIGGDQGTGGNTVVPVECGFEAEGLFCIDDCQATDGPGDRVKNADFGAFTEDKTWMDGWTNWSLNSSHLTEAQVALRADALKAANAATHVISADIAANKTLTADQAWIISGTVHVLDGVTLTIEPGTLVMGDNNPQGVLVVSRGGKLIAEGEADKPIIFTSVAVDGDRAKGQWGGVVLLGKASNFSGNNVNIEGLANDPLNQHGPGAGAADDTHDCGSLKYVRIEFSGIEIGTDNEINGLTTGSCGSNTKISYVAVDTTLDDGFEFFGGANSADHLVVNNAGDDMFDFDTGWRGTIDTFFGRQVVPTTDDPNGLEWDSSNAGAPETPGNQPSTNANAINGTLCGTGKLGKPNFGAVLREKITGSIENVAFMGFDAAFDIRDNFLVGGTGPGPKLTIEKSATWYNIDGVAFVEDATKVTGTQACTDEPKKYLCDDDLNFDEVTWFEDGDGNVAGANDEP